MASAFSGPSAVSQTSSLTAGNAISIAVTGIGCVSPLGAGTRALWDAVVAGRALAENGLAAIPPEREAPLAKDLGVSENPPPRFLILAWHAIRQAMQLAGWDRLNADDGLILGTTTGNILVWEGGVIEAGDKSAPPDALATALRRHEPMGVTLHTLADLLKFEGRMRLVTTACSSSTQAIALGAQWIQSGRVKRCLVGGAEVLSRLTVEGFRCLQLLAARPASPFDAERTGINLAEGSAFLCLEAGRSPRALAYLGGYGITSDAHHLTAPHPEGRGCHDAMQAALKMAGLEPTAIDWVYAHGTGSAANDLSEGLAIRRLFGENAPPVSSTKGCHGHTLAASGALESVLAVHALREGILPTTTGLRTPDPKIPVTHPSEVQRRALRHVMKNSLGFGGANASLVWSAT